jgi:hypothetical protein
MKLIRFATGLAIGYVLGSRAGRERYEQIVALVRKARQNPTVAQAQQKAQDVVAGAAATATHKVADKITPSTRASKRRSAATVSTEPLA